MALRLKLKPQRLLPLRSFSSSTTTPPPDSTAAADAEDPSPSVATPPPPPPSYSNFSDIKERLRSAPTPPRRIPENPPPPSIFSSSNRSSPASLEDIRKKLAEFTHRSAGPSSPSSSPSPSPPTLSFQELFKNSVRGDGSAPAEKRDRLSFSSIRESLSKVKRDGPQTPSPNSFNLREFQRSLEPNRGTGILGNVDPLPRSIFGREMKEEEGGGGESKGLKTEFLKMYTYEELGEKLRKLRPDAAAKGGNDWFSLAELNERLAKLRELEEKESESRMGGVSFRDLRESLVKLKEGDANKKASSGFSFPLYI